MKVVKFLLWSAMMPLAANAVSIDSMVLVGDDSGNGVFSLSNNEKYTEFVTGKIAKYDVQGDVIHKTPYDENNVSDWELTLTNPKLILESGRTKQVGVRSLCGKTCDFQRDHVFQINFVPVPYSDGDNKAPVVALNIGYAPLYIIPAKNQNIKYKVKNEGETIYVENNGNSFFRLGIDQCSDEIKKGCRAAFTVLSGRHKHFNLPKGVQSDELNIVIINHDETFVRRFNLKKED